MRFTNKTELGAGGDAYNFKIGKSELVVLFEVLCDVQRRTPQSLFTQPLTSRVNQMKTEIAQLFAREGMKLHITRNEFKKHFTDKVF